MLQVGFGMIVGYFWLTLSFLNPLDNGLLIEEWGGDIIAVSVSALTGEGIDDLLESINIVSEISEFKANPEGLATGVVLEAKLDKSRGPVATLIVKSGTISIGNILVVGPNTGKIRSLMDSMNMWEIM